MTIGPVEYVIIGFPGNRFNGKILPEFANLVDQGIVRFLDVVFIKKDSFGNIERFEYDGLDDVAEFGFADIDGTIGGVISDDDIDVASEVLAPDTSAALIVWEHLWATRAADAVRDSGGVIIGGERIPHDLVEAAMAGLD